MEEFGKWGGRGNAVFEFSGGSTNLGFKKLGFYCSFVLKHTTYPWGAALHSITLLKNPWLKAGKPLRPGMIEKIALYMAISE